MTRLHAAVRRLAPDIAAGLVLDDVAAGDGLLFVRDRIGVAARGVAARAHLDDVAEVLGSIERLGDDDGPAPIALGCVPFERATPSTFVVPAESVVVRGDGTAWSIRVASTRDAADAPVQVVMAPPPPPTGGGYRVAPVAPVEQYLRAVEAVRDAVVAGRLRKAVIAREIRVDADQPIDVHAVLTRLRAAFGSSYRYSIDGFIGASPELLVEVAGATVSSHPLAGTAPRAGDPDTDARAAAALIASTKNQVEHRAVIEMVHDTLLPWCSFLDWEPEPSIVTVANVQHLGSRVVGHLSDPRPHVLELVRALCPTPALGGAPRDVALALIAEVEGFPRGRYGGAVGWVDADGDGTWAVAIRGAEVSADRRTARLVAGGGIVADSEPLAELAETQAKFQAMLSAIIRP